MKALTKTVVILATIGFLAAAWTDLPKDRVVMIEPIAPVDSLVAMTYSFNEKYIMMSIPLTNTSGSKSTVYYRDISGDWVNKTQEAPFESLKSTKGTFLSSSTGKEYACLADDGIIREYYENCEDPTLTSSDAGILTNHPRSVGYDSNSMKGLYQFGSGAFVKYLYFNKERNPRSEFTSMTPGTGVVQNYMITLGADDYYFFFFTTSCKVFKRTGSTYSELSNPVTGFGGFSSLNALR